MLTQKRIDEFWSKVDIRGEDECWEWKGSLQNQGYGQYWTGRTNKGTHVIAYTLTYGEVPVGKVACHTCDNRRCCNPKHIWVGTQLENIEDMVKKGRTAKGDRSGARVHPELMSKGESAGRAKWTEEEVKKMREEYASGKAIFQIAKERNGESSNISRIVRRLIWKHLD